MLKCSLSVRRNNRARIENQRFNQERRSYIKWRAEADSCWRAVDTKAASLTRSAGGDEESIFTTEAGHVPAPDPTRARLFRAKLAREYRLYKSVHSAARASEIWRAARMAMSSK